MTIILEAGYQTYLSEVLPPIRQQVEKLNWLVTGLQCWGDNSPPIETWHLESYDSAPYYNIVPGQTLYEAFAHREVQVVWGVFCGVPGDIPAIPLEEVPYADGNRRIWTEPEVFLLAASEIEIVAFDSSFTLVKFRDESLGRQFLEAFPSGRIVQSPDDMLKSYQ
ncbi:hypothetical protein E5K00_18360 [Hymenobacter aquaticus]|uniref:Uncharacterized protein n=1 Tax=Hymenobacter aquaticus TaxID=1867101 RepID=A0A4Z0PZ87_9BACT|nr:hypothetical protein [Hymenobacter aquaticus]TGE22211.1 hypothetical protein E5K00_18360 [Hymenobacter aquaticus]